MSARLHSIVLLALLFVGISAIRPSTATAQDSEVIRAMLESRDRDIKMILADGSLSADKREQLKDVINGVIDFEAMGKQALGRYWADLGARQRSEFVDVFSDIVRRQSVADLGVYESTVTYNKVDVDGAAARVETMTTYKDSPTSVVYIMGLRDGEWKVQDIILSDVSTAEGYARSFQSVVRKKGFDTLMTKLRAKRDKMTESS